MWKRADRRSPIYYLYEHWRPDENVCFYVGKGFGNRAWDLRKRNRHHTHIIAKLKSLGLSLDVRLISECLTETEALEQEVRRIAYYRDLGVKLTNITNGGDGVSGLIVSEETRAKLSAAATGRKNGPLSASARAKISAAHKGRKLSPEHIENHRMKLLGKKHTEEHKRKISESHKGHRNYLPEDYVPYNKGKKASEELRQKLSDAHKGKKLSDETRAKMAEAQKRRWQRPGVLEKAQDRWKDPEFSTRMSVALRKAFDNPERLEHAKRAAKMGAKKRWHPEDSD